MSTIYLERTLGVSADELWQQVRDVGGVSNMLNVIAASSLDGDQRRCEMGDGAMLAETIFCVDDEHHRVGYTITDSPFPIEHHAASMQVFDEGDGRSTFRWVTDVKPDAMADGLGPLMQSEMDQLAERYPS